MARIPQVTPERAGLFTKLLYWIGRRKFGVVPEPFKVAAHHRPLLWAGGVHETLAELGSKTLPQNVRELAVYRTAVRLSCEWCIDYGTMLQRMSGLDIERLREIDDYPTSDKFDRPERLALAYADAMTATPVTVTDEQVAELTQEFGHKGVIELTYQIALENMRARTNTALGITEQGFSDGEFCMVPPLREFLNQVR